MIPEILSVEAPDPFPGASFVSRSRFNPNFEDSNSRDRRYGVDVDSHGWTVTIDAAYPAGVVELVDDSIHRFLDSIEQYRGALNVGRLGHRGLVVTLSIGASELDEPTREGATARARAIVRECLDVIGVRGDWELEVTEACHDDEPESLHAFSAAVTE